MAESSVKTEGDAAPRPKAGYKSWKKKYRKMRISFENKMHEGEDIFKQEAKAQATVKRLAIENDRLLDILLEVNNSAQIPLEKRVNISLPPSKSSDRIHPIDQDYENQKELPLKRLEDLLNDVPHQPYRLAKESDPHLVAELEKSEGDNYPAHFLCADDIDNYLHLIDQNIEPDNPVPTLAPLAHPTTNPPLHPLLKNPNSATSWLRRHAPHIFLQGIQEPGAEPHEDASTAGGADEAASTHTPSHTGGRGREHGRRRGPQHLHARQQRQGRQAQACDRGRPGLPSQGVHQPADQEEAQERGRGGDADRSQVQEQGGAGRVRRGGLNHSQGHGQGRERGTAGRERTAITDLASWLTARVPGFIFTGVFLNGGLSRQYFYFIFRLFCLPCII